MGVKPVDVAVRKGVCGVNPRPAVATWSVLRSVAWRGPTPFGDGPCSSECAVRRVRRQQQVGGGLQLGQPRGQLPVGHAREHARVALRQTV